MSLAEFQKYFNTHVKITFDSGSVSTGAVINSRKPGKDQNIYYFITSRDMLDYKVAYLQNDEETMKRIEGRIDICDIQKVSHLKETAELYEKYAGQNTSKLNH